MKYAKVLVAIACVAYLGLALYKFGVYSTTKIACITAEVNQSEK